jgi:uncharacterized protein (TIGR03067 family)
MSLLLPTLLVLATTTTGILPGDDRRASALNGLDGTWQAEEAELAGKKWPDEVTKSIQLVITKGKYLVKTAEGDDRGTVQYMPDQKPSAMDITGTEGPNKGKRFLAIYKLDGDKLVVCYDLTGKARPQEFKTQAGTAMFLVTYRKQRT